MPATFPALSEVGMAICIFLILLVPLAIAGVALINTGFVRSRSAAHAMLSTLCVVAIAAGVYFVCGFALEGYAGRPMHAISIAGKQWSWLADEKFFFRGLELDGSPASLAALLQIFGVGWRRRFRLAAQRIAGGLGLVPPLPCCWPVASIRCSRTGLGVADGWLSSASTTRSAAALSIAAVPARFRPLAG